VAKKEVREEMTLEEAKAFRRSLYKPQKRELSEPEKRSCFKLFWAQNRKKYGRKKDLEAVLWVHLQSIGKDQPEMFEDGLAHFGLKRIR
jgi:hypothetical protein